MVLRKDYLDNRYARAMANRKILLTIKKELKSPAEIEQCEQALSRNRKAIKELKTAYTCLNYGKQENKPLSPTHEKFC